MSQVKRFFISFDPPAENESRGQIESYLLRSGRHDRPLRSSLLGRPSFRRLHYLLGEERLQEFEYPAIRHFLLYAVDQRRVRNRIEIAFQVGIDHPVVSGLQQGIDLPQRILAAPIRTEPVAVHREVPLKDRLQHCPSAVCATRSRTVGTGVS